MTNEELFSPLQGFNLGFSKKGEGEQFLWFQNVSLEFIDVQQTQITWSCMCVAFLISIDKEGQDIYELIERKKREKLNHEQIYIFAILRNFPSAPSESATVAYVCHMLWLPTYKNHWMYLFSF